MARHSLHLVLFACSFLINSSCSDESSSACSGSDLCPFVGNWVLTELFIDGSASEANYTGYALNLKPPVGSNTSADYSRNFGNGDEEAGTWTVMNKGDVMMLTIGGEEEEYIVEEISPNNLILILYPESNKPGPEEIRYIFEK